MLDKQMIPHLKALDVGSKIVKNSSVVLLGRNDHATFLVKSTHFKEEFAR